MPDTGSNTPQNSGIRVDAVRIHNFRSLRNIELELGKTCLLVGMNNTGKTSLLRALHLALGADRRLISQDDFFIDDKGQQANAIIIDVRIIPLGKDDSRAQEFPSAWFDSDFGGGSLISTDSLDNQFIAVRTRITYDAVKSDYELKRLRLQEWLDFDGWTGATEGSPVRRFDQLASFFIDAQRDIIADLRSRSSYFGWLLSKIEIPEEAVVECSR